MDTPHKLARPTAFMLTKLTDRITFLYLNICRIEQDDNGTHATVTLTNGEKLTTYLPTAQLTTLLLGPGTSITNPAATALARNGCNVIFVGDSGVRTYSAFVSPNTSTRLLHLQAQAFANPDEKTRIAAAMYNKRFGEASTRLPPGLTIETLRGMEGARMKAIYRTHANRVRQPNWRRDHSSPDLDPINEALNFANTALYGVTTAVTLGLGLSPGLGFVHSGTRNAFVLDIADLYKTKTTIPAAFACANEAQPGKKVMSRLREDFKLLKLIPTLVDDINELLDPEAAEPHDPDEWEAEKLALWGPNQSVLSGPNYGP